MQARAETEALPLTDLGKPYGPFPQDSRIRALRHKHDMARISPQDLDHLQNLGEIFGTLDNKLKLVAVTRDEPLQDLRLVTEPLVLRRPPAAFARG